MKIMLIKKCKRYDVTMTEMIAMIVRFIVITAIIEQQ